MAIAAKLSSAELTAQVTDRFENSYFEARLINAPGVTYNPGTTNDTTFLGFEVTHGTGGYYPQSFNYTSSDILVYSDDGVPLNTKVTVFPHDGGATPIVFSHVAMVWAGAGQALTISAAAGAPDSGTNGTYTNILQSSTDGSGTGLMVDITVTNSGAAPSDFALTLSNAGSGHAATDIITISETDLKAANVIPSGATGNLSFTVDSVTSATANSGNILAVAQTTATVNLIGGNEAAFYWNLKQFGYYSV